MIEKKTEPELLLNKNRIIRIIFITLGITSVILGIIGIFLTVMPTTVFLLLEYYIFARGSDKFNQWLLNNKILGNYIRNYKEGRGMTAGSKIFSISFLWCGILLSVIFLLENIYIKLLLLVIAVVISIHILYIKTFNPKK
jgi:uncharacterized membrane protein YbaN (DUF454 family)